MQLPFEYATAAGPSKWIWAAAEVKHRYRVTRDHQGFNIHVKWDPATCNDKKVGHYIELWRDRNGREMVPMQLCSPDTEHLTGTEYTGQVQSACPLAQPQKQNRKAPAAQGVIDLLDACRGPGRTRPAPTNTGPQQPAPTEAHARINILKEPAVTYDPTKPATLQAMPGPHP